MAVPTLENWKAGREELRQQLFEMLSLSPLPPRTDLKAVTPSTVDADSFTVENLYFQSMPGLYVTANFYLPKRIKGRYQRSSTAVDMRSCARMGLATGTKRLTSTMVLGLLATATFV